MEIRRFYTDKLRITNEVIKTIKWNEIVNKIVDYSRREKLIYDSENDLTIYSILCRIMRKDNFFIAMIDNNILDNELNTAEHKEIEAEMLRIYNEHASLNFAENMKEYGSLCNESIIRSVFMMSEVSALNGNLSPIYIPGHYKSAQKKNIPKRVINHLSILTK